MFFCFSGGAAARAAAESDSLLAGAAFVTEDVNGTRVHIKGQ